MTYKYGEYMKMVIMGEGDTASVAIHLASEWTRGGQNLALIDMMGSRAYLADLEKIDILQLGKDSPFPEYQEYNPQSLAKLMKLVSDRGYEVLIIDGADVIMEQGGGKVDNAVVDAIIGLPLHVVVLFDEWDVRGENYFIIVAEASPEGFEFVKSNIALKTIISLPPNTTQEQLEAISHEIVNGKNRHLAISSKELAVGIQEWMAQVEPLAYGNGDSVPNNATTTRLLFQFMADHEGDLPFNGDELREWHLEVA